MLLLDLLPYNPNRPVVNIPETKPVIKKVITDSANAVHDSLGAVRDSVAETATQTQMMIEGTGVAQAEASSLLLPIAVVAVALAACLWMAYLYKVRTTAIANHGEGGPRR